MARHSVEKRHDPAPNERFAARNPQLFDAKTDKGAAQPIQLFERQEVLFGEKLHILGHAIDAAEIATVCNGHPKVFNRACEGIDELLFHDREGRAVHGLLQGASDR